MPAPCSSAASTLATTFTDSVRALYILSGYGHLAVMIFFVLSGFLVGGAVVRAVQNGRFSWRHYLIQRLTRLEVVLIPALFLTLAWDAGEAAQSRGQTPNDDTAIANIKSTTIRDHTSPTIFAGNIAFLQRIEVPPFGSNTPLWSLANEFWYYLAFPLIWLALASANLKIAYRFIFLLLTAAILYFVGERIALYFLIWLLGAFAAFAPGLAILRNWMPRHIVGSALMLGVLASLIAVRLGKVPDGMIGDSIVSITFAFLLWCLKHNSQPAMLPWLRHLTAFFADFSYTLYLVHLPPLIFLRACWTYETAWPPVAEAWLKLFAIVGAIMIYAYLISLVTEKQTPRVRAWLERRLV